MADRAGFRQGSWFDGLDERFDLILANPPYIKTSVALPPDVADHEPHQALFAGDDGLDAYRAIAPALAEHLSPGGAAMIEIGWDQGQSAARLFSDEGLTVGLKRDLAGKDRCLIVVR